MNLRKMILMVFGVLSGAQVFAALEQELDFSQMIQPEFVELCTPFEREAGIALQHRVPGIRAIQDPQARAREAQELYDFFERKLPAEDTAAYNAPLFKVLISLGASARLNSDSLNPDSFIQILTLLNNKVQENLHAIEKFKINLADALRNPPYEKMIQDMSSMYSEAEKFSVLFSIVLDHNKMFLSHDHCSPLVQSLSAQIELCKRNADAVITESLIQMNDYVESIGYRVNVVATEGKEAITFSRM